MGKLQGKTSYGFVWSGLARFVNEPSQALIMLPCFDCLLHLVIDLIWFGCIHLLYVLVSIVFSCFNAGG
uniref:Uncharacterized protein n=1 Tax=Helianthus annuus TaxID=4232 RepID=A0A251U849_HELAN